MKRTEHRRRRRRRGSILVLSLIVVALLTLGAMTFFERMHVEHRAATAHRRQTQARHLADSGVEYVRALVTQDATALQQAGGTYDNPTLFQGQLVFDDPLAAYRGRFTVLAPALRGDGYLGGVRYGLEDESARLNLNTLVAAFSGEEDGAREVLMALPGMTESIADAILDWIDEDQQPRMFGAEQEYYSTLAPPYVPRNGPLQSIEELLLVRDVTPQLLFGADLNRNGVVDPSEEPYAAIPNVDNSTGSMNRGWSAYFTVDSAERNVRPDGTPKININMRDLRTLHQQAQAVLGDEMANFIIAYRQGGRYEEASGRRVSASSLTPDFDKPANVSVETLLDLVGIFTVVSEGEQQGQTQSVESPFRDDPSAMRDYLPKLLDNFTTSAGPSIPGRLNINQAPRPLLAAVPGLTLDQVDQILANRRPEGAPERADQNYETWILTDGIVDVEEMRELMPLLTAGGDVYRVQVVGSFDGEGPVVRLEAIIDATQSPPVVRRRRELTELGPGYSPEALGAISADAP